MKLLLVLLVPLPLPLFLPSLPLPPFLFFFFFSPGFPFFSFFSPPFNGPSVEERAVLEVEDEDGEVEGARWAAALARNGVTRGAPCTGDPTTGTAVMATYRPGKPRAARATVLGALVWLPLALSHNVYGRV